MDERYLALTPEDIETEFWAYHYAENNVNEEIEDDDFDIEAFIAQADDVDDWETVIDD